jgi:hypothetical protein
MQYSVVDQALESCQCSTDKILIFFYPEFDLPVSVIDRDDGSRGGEKPLTKNP